ncbi:histidine kinase N-terminal 7TM domain-containing protein [Halobellus marinus]|uniref:histidine kinase N-terminal 7TM domain-containing protein n=1 Tax=Halobellus TaxID=1073986 RepID=UPI0028AA01F0|nr:histidine kinase N-terminal 7TM domain-containing protein [Halobellus sp. DFY28]
MSEPIPLLLSLLLSVVLGSASAILAWREGSKPGARALVLLLSGQVLWSITLIFRLQAPTVEAKLFWMHAMWVGVVAVPLGWILFALEYTGRDRYMHPRYVATLAAIPVVTVVLVALGPYQDLLRIGITGSIDAGTIQNENGGVWYWIVAIYTYLVGAAGGVLLLELVLSQMFTFRKQAYALIGALIAPWATNLGYLADILATPIDPTPIAFSFSGVIYLFALRHFDLLRTNPAPNNRARKLVFDGVQEGVIVLDIGDTVIDINEPALEMLQETRDEVLGSPAPKKIPDYEEFPESGSFGDFLTVETRSGDRSFEVEVTPITSDRGKTIGRVVTFKEITEFLRQEQRLEVLNRVLRHNIKTETNLLLGYAEDLSGENAERMKESVLRIDELGQKGREAIRLFSRAREESDFRSLHTIGEECVREARSRFPDVTVEYRRAGRDASVNSVLDSVLLNAIENAAEHNDSDDPRIEIVTGVTDEQVTVEIRDNGPGISDYELAVLSAGAESSLKHGSGIGLWIIKWGAELLGGRVQFSDNDPTGTVIEIAVPPREA